jgi:hypothetical protein
MAALVGLVVGAVFGWLLPATSLRKVLAIPLGVAGVELVVNATRFGVSAIVLWGPILLALTCLATLASWKIAHLVQLRRGA